jgi:hypothetical protein
MALDQKYQSRLSPVMVRALQTIFAVLTLVMMTSGQALACDTGGGLEPASHEHASKSEPSASVSRDGTPSHTLCSLTAAGTNTHATAMHSGDCHGGPCDPSRHRGSACDAAHAHCCSVALVGRQQTFAFQANREMRRLDLGTSLTAGALSYPPLRPPSWAV